MHMTSKELCALLYISLSTIALPSDPRTEQRRQRFEARTARQQAAEEQAQLRQAREEAQSAQRKRIADTTTKQWLNITAKRVRAILPRRIDATQNCTICQEGLQEAACHLVETTCKHVFHETCMTSLLSYLPQGANQSQIDTQKCPNCYTVIRTLGQWDVELECRKGPFCGPKLKRYKTA